MATRTGFIDFNLWRARASTDLEIKQTRVPFSVTRTSAMIINGQKLPGQLRSMDLPTVDGIFRSTTFKTVHSIGVTLGLGPGCNVAGCRHPIG